MSNIPSAASRKRAMVDKAGITTSGAITDNKFLSRVTEKRSSSKGFSSQKMTHVSGVRRNKFLLLRSFFREYG